MAILDARQFAAALLNGSKKANIALRRTLQDAARQAWKMAKEYAPKSPTVKQARAARKAAWEAKHGKSRATTRAFNAAQERGKNRRKANSHSRHAPGGLEDSIKWRMRGRGLAQDAEVYVAANAPAGKYAARIHDEKGRSWVKRGPGTVAKGAKADDKYILRAVEEVRKTLPARFDKHLARLGGIV